MMGMAVLNYDNHTCILNIRTFSGDTGLRDANDAIDFGKGLALTQREKDRHSFLSQTCEIFLESAFIVATLISVGSVAAGASPNPRRHGSSGCIGCDNKAKLILSSNKSLRRQKIKGSKAPVRSTSEDFWTTSTRDMDTNVIQSRGSISSISTSAQAHDAHSSGSTNTPSEFVNHGLNQWNQIRQQWVGSKKPENQSQELREPRLSWNATYDSLLASNKPFAQPIPLPEMIDFLVDIWEQDGWDV
nr:Prickle-like protein [Ipomoea batatas]